MNEISVFDLKSILENNANNALIIDVRRQDERDECYINGTIHIPLDELPLRLDEVIELAQHKHLCFYCRSGARSANATTVFLQAGFTNVSNVKGGILDWQKAGFQIIKKEN